MVKRGKLDRAKPGRMLLLGYRRDDEDLGARHGVREVERGQLDLQELMMGWRWGGQENRKQEDSRQLVVPITAAETQ